MNCILKYVLVFVLLGFSLPGNAQKDLSFSIQAPVQLDFQRAEITYGPYELQRSSTINFGIIISATKQLSKAFFVSVGIGYFRERFNVRRPYNHQLLNPGVDSFLILTKTNYYTYHLLEIPLSIKYALKSFNRHFFFKVEYVPAFYFSKSYVGGKPFATANITQNRFDFWSHSINFKMEFKFRFNQNADLSIEPFVRLFHAYKGDDILFEDNTNSISRNTDALGISLNYYFKSRH